jgi:LasA protease
MLNASFRSSQRAALGAGMLLLTVLACVRGDVPLESQRIIDPWIGQAPTEQAPLATDVPTPSFVELLPPTRKPDEPYLTPTPDAVRAAPSIRSDTAYHVVQPGESLGGIAVRYGVSANQLSNVNELYNPNYLAIGQTLVVPPPIVLPPGPNFKIIPDSELVYGPASMSFDLRAAVGAANGYLASYTEDVEGRSLTGEAIVQLVSQQYSVNPRLLLAILEYQSGWLTQRVVSQEARYFPVGVYGVGMEGLFTQLSWAADQLNAGFYLWEAGWAGPYVFDDGSVVVPGAGINAGTAGVQYFFSQLFPPDRWREIVGESGFYHTLIANFGNPFDRAVEPLLPQDLQQPEMQLPFEPGVWWSYTGGPHGGWGSGAGWAALDFAPPGELLGCVWSDEWVLAVADGLILRSEEGEVIQDLDFDGYEQTGWVLLYMHVESRDRVQVGSFLHAGDRIGHASCEGGFSTGTHIHIARKYNGVWIPADGDIPFVMDGWVSAGSGIAYEGTMKRGTVTLEACACRNEFNQISR